MKIKQADKKITFRALYNIQIFKTVDNPLTDSESLSLPVSHTAKYGVGVITIALKVSNNILMSSEISAGPFNEFMNEIIISMKPGKLE